MRKGYKEFFGFLNGNEPCGYCKNKKECDFYGGNYYMNPYENTGCLNEEEEFENFKPRFNFWMDMIKYNLRRWNNYG